MTYDLTPEEIAVARRAANRYGMSNPSYVDIIDELTPLYADKVPGKGTRNPNARVTNNVPCPERSQVERWHRVSRYAMTLVYRL